MRLLRRSLEIRLLHPPRALSELTRDVHSSSEYFNDRI